MPYKPNLNPIYLQISKIRLEEAACLGFLAGSSKERKDKLVINFVGYVELFYTVRGAKHYQPTKQNKDE